MPSGRFLSSSVGYDHSCGVRESGEVTCWGSNDWGQTDAPAGVFRAVEAGYQHTCGIRESGEVACWGGDGVPRALRGK